MKVSRLTWRKKRFVWLSGQVLFPYVAKKEGLDSLLFPGIYRAGIGPGKKAITVHDFINIEYPLYRKRSGALRPDLFLSKDKTLHRADRIISVSHYTKGRIKSSAGLKKRG